MSVDTNGVTFTTANGQQTLSWDDFNSIPPAQQKTILTSAGVPSNLIDPILSSLQKTEQTQYSQYQAKQAHDTATHKGLYGAIAGIPVLGGISNQISQTAADLSGGQLGGKALERIPGNQQLSQAQIEQNTGLAGLIKQAGVQQAVSGVTGNTTQTFPAYTPQELNAYANNYVKPVLQMLDSRQSADDSAIQAAIASVAKATGQSNSPTTQLVNAYEKLNDPAQTKLIDQTYGVQALAPYLGAINTAVGASATEGAKALQQGAAYQYLAQQQLANATGNTSGSAFNSALASIIPSAITGVTGSSTGTTTTP